MWYWLSYFKRRKTTKQRTKNNLKELDELIETSNWVLTKVDYSAFNELKRIIDKDNLNTHQKSVWVMLIMKAHEGTINRES